MKHLFLYFVSLLIIAVSCGPIKKLNSPDADDVYANPKEYRAEEARLALQKKQQEEQRIKRYNDSINDLRTAMMQKDANNPYYQDREFSYDDYYDYEYATRLRRFNNPINGLGYYDNYYTNSYWYNQNPYNYGVSVYNGYGWWGNNYNYYSYNPSVYFYQNWGWGNYPGWGYNGYNPYSPYGNSYGLGFNQGYNMGYYNGWNGYPYYNGFGGYPYYGYGNPYGGFNNGWGYFNIYDNNSKYTYAPRSSHGGANSERTSNPGVVGGEYYERHLSNVAAQQEKVVKFAEIPTVKVNEVNAYQYNSTVNETLKNSIKNNSYSEPVSSPVRNQSNWKNEAIENTKSIEIIPPRNYTNPSSTSPTKQYEIKTVAPVRQNGNFNQSEPTRIKAEPKQENYSSPNKQEWNSRPSNGGSSPSRTPASGSGTNRPR